MILEDIYSVILERQKNPQSDSYVSSLISQGKDEILKKIGEEAIEVIVASKSGDRQKVIHEFADLWFHCLVLMAEEGVTVSDILLELENRSGRKRKAHE